jgi:pSer/pThr/pTyr-binding forkhead associated (FHA) protein
MVLLQVLSGKTAGTALVARRFPVRIGRSADSELRLEEAGVWDRHARVEFVRRQGFLLQAEPSAFVRIDGEDVQSRLLRNGDTIELGSAKLRFSLAEVKQARLGIREVFTWFLVAGISVVQVALVYLLLRL